MGGLIREVLERFLKTVLERFLTFLEGFRNFGELLRGGVDWWKLEEGLGKGEAGKVS